MNPISNSTDFRRAVAEEEEEEEEGREEGEEEWEEEVC